MIAGLLMLFDLLSKDLPKNLHEAGLPTVVNRKTLGEPGGQPANESVSPALFTPPGSSSRIFSIVLVLYPSVSARRKREIEP